MMKGLIAAVLVFWMGLGSAVAMASDLTIDTAEKQIDITTGFNGAFLHVYGVRQGDGDVVITVRGPERHKIVRRKSQIAGIWINADAMKFRHIPVYYDFAATAGGLETLGTALSEEHMIGLDALRFQPDIRDETQDMVGNFQEALVRNYQRAGVYPLRPQDIDMMDNGLFKARFYIPANVPTGAYTIEAFLVRDGQIAEKQSLNLKIGQVGMSANIYQFAKNNALLYGLCCVFIALSAGLGATFVRRS